MAKILSDENLDRAIEEVNASHRWFDGHTPNACTAWVEETRAERIRELRKIILAGFEQAEPRHRRQWDPNAKKWRDINEPKQWPDQYVHHALVQALMPVMMRGMDPYCSGSIRGRGGKQVQRCIRKWMEHDQKGTRYCGTADVYHCYGELKPEVVMARFRRLVCDRAALDLLWRCIKDGVLIGAFPSQWCCNTTFQPLDQMIRQSGLCRHYVRYMDNITVFGPNKRKLRRLMGRINAWLEANRMALKGDWQVYRTEAGARRPKALEAPRRGVERPKRRLPSAVGYRYGRGYTIPRKHNVMNLKRDIRRYSRYKARGQPMPYKLASSLLCRLGRLKRCNNAHLYAYLFQGQKVARDCKAIIREKTKKWRDYTWSTFLAERAQRRLCGQRAAATAT